LRFAVHLSDELEPCRIILRGHGAYQACQQRIAAVARHGLPQRRGVQCEAAAKPDGGNVCSGGLFGCWRDLP
jgi:hypothetical protein